MKEIKEFFNTNLRTTKLYALDRSAKTCPISNWVLPFNNNFDCGLTSVEQIKIKRANKYLKHMLKLI